MSELGMKKKDYEALLGELQIKGDLEPEDFEVVLQTLTLASQLVNIDDYLTGKATIEDDTPKPAAKPAEAPAKEEKPAQKPAAKAEEKPAEKPVEKSAEKAEEMPAAKVEPKVEEKPVAQPEQKKAPEKKPAKKQELRTIDLGAVTPKQGGGETVVVKNKSRVVDTRTAAVDLSKYDDTHTDRYAPYSGRGGDSVGKQKLKKQNNNQPQSQKGARDSKKERERLEKERQKRLEMEAARKKQLEITLPDEITVGELAARMKKTSAEVIKKLMMMGVMASVNQTVDYDTAYLVCDEMGIKVTKEVVDTIEEKLFDETEDTAEDLVERAPVVCVMGHVDHGKTSLLDYIRNAHVTKGEAGGITQHIGAYRAEVKGKDITFLDTPGHEAFTAMRARGAMATDIAILVVAADDGIMPQTVEAINHAKAAGIDIIVAINKMDKPEANPEQIKQELTQYDLVPEEWGGDVICVPVSAKTGMGVEDLLENVLLVAEVKELRANPNRRAAGLIIESRLDRGRGPVATVLVQKGTLEVGDIVIAGTAVGRVRAMVGDNGKTLKKAGPSVPVEIIGLAEVPSAGDEFNAVEDEKMARTLAEQRREKAKAEAQSARAGASLDDLFAQMAEGVKKLDIIVKADVAGSAEAVKANLVKLSNDEVRVSVIHAGVGAINEGDVMLANASNAIIVGFNVRPDKGASESAERNGVEIRTYRVIYECIEEIEAAMKGMLAPTYKETMQGKVEVREVIHVARIGAFIAGCYVLSGKVTRQSLVRVVRDGIVVFDRKAEPLGEGESYNNRIGSLKRFKDDVREVAEGYECGITLERYSDLKVGDILEVYTMDEVER
ncbi:MAG: translation initiation factor IF-2 [Clostridia bacterium]|nr:translation initiation factor IF-2 [Clostridia bacterium]